MILASVSVIVTILIVGSSTFMLTDSHSLFQRLEDPRIDAGEKLPFIPHHESPTFYSNDDIYSFNFSAEEGDKIHFGVSVSSKDPVQIILMPTDELSDYPDDRTFHEVEKISEGSNISTRSFKAHITIPEGDEYSLVLRPLTIGGLAGFGITVEVIIGRGLFSSMVVWAGGYVAFFGISSFLMIVLFGGVYLYLYMKKKNESSTDEDPEGSREEYMDTSEKYEVSDSKDPPQDEEISTDELEETEDQEDEYLQYGD